LTCVDVGRMNQVIFRAENVLEPELLVQMLEVSRRVAAIRTPANLTWQHLCFRSGPEAGSDQSSSSTEH
jgi:hypothetical protein